MHRISLFILLCFVSITASKAQEKFEIDEEGNIILLEEKPKPSSPPPEKPSAPTPRAPTPPRPTPKQPPPQTLPDPEKAPPVSNIEPAPIKTQSDLHFPLSGAVVVKVAQLRAGPSNEARIVALLRQGDKLQLFSENSGYLEAEYLLEGQYPIRGYILMESLQLFKDGKPLEVAKAFEQKYEAPQERPEVQTKATELEATELSEEVDIPVDPQLKPTKREEAPSERALRSPKQYGLWLWSARFSVGWTEYSEALKTKIDGEPADGNFLDYSLNGYKLVAELGVGREFSSFWGGARLRYSLSILDGSISGANPQIQSASVLGQLHEIGLEARALRSWDVWKFRFEPELSMGPQLQLFSVNQLRDRSLAHPVLFSEFGVYFQTAFIPRLHLPYHLSVEPFAAINLAYWFLEGPQESTENGPIRTGTPQMSLFGYEYGASLAWELQSLQLDGHHMKLSYRMRNYSKAYSGEGNRAGFVTEDVRSQMQIQSLSLGYEYRF